MIEQLLKELTEKKGSDLHVKVGSRPMIRIDGELQPINGVEVILPKDMEIMERELLDERKREKFRKNKNIDFSYAIPALGRYRINMFMQRGTIAVAIRRILQNIQSLEKLGLPDVLKEVIKEKRGLILITGAAGNGKSTTVAAMIEYINENLTRNIITLEDPIEYLFKDKKSLISQREIPSDIENYNQALKYIIRQDPDIIYIGELRDKETLEAAFKAAETGHLVISTVHTVNASQTITRILDYFPKELQQRIRNQLSSNLLMVTSQRLLPKKQGKGRVAAIEVMRTTPTIKDLILTVDGYKKIPEAMKLGKKEDGMKTFDQSIEKLYTNGEIEYETALSAATVKKDIQLLKRGINHASASDYYKEMIE
ncbi:type IV pilus twitching motility protein PilT [Haliovirga abyssi]|uniref:Twitching motility protein PilT n=1 Tax=Haliovirga abyssi TaxID=2996794 RepID=A0AAU9DGI4_9FUSO|nr:PilT/PilU family type 4a pilus ATPase [Haliovirga abyssi]BDU49799.1 twitching motility protein PilT [Haliovirga abyssi]